MGSGWGESSSRGDWYATVDFNFRNLVIRAEEKLPPAWQRSENVKYLKQNYGEDCVVRRDESVVGSELKSVAPKKMTRKRIV